MSDFKDNFWKEKTEKYNTYFYIKLSEIKFFLNIYNSIQNESLLNMHTKKLTYKDNHQFWSLKSFISNNLY